MKQRDFERPSSATFHVVTHVWGREYLDLFLNVRIPNQLAAGNVPALPSGSRYRILTRSTHVDEIERHPNVRALRELIPVDSVVIADIDRKDGVARRYDLMVACHRKAVRDALDAQAALIFLSADVVVSDATFAHVVRRHQAGSRAVMVAAPRIIRERCRHQVGRPIAARELMRLVPEHLHPMIERQVIDAREFAVDPSAALWRVGAEGLLGRYVQLHPLMLDPVQSVLPSCTIDDVYIGDAVPSMRHVHVVTDSDEIAVIELTPHSMRGRGARDDRRIERMCRMALIVSEAGPHHRAFWQQTIRLHGGPLDRAVWHEAEQAASRFANRVEALSRWPMLARLLLFMSGPAYRGAGHARRRIRRTRKRLHRALRIGRHRAGELL